MTLLTISDYNHKKRKYNDMLKPFCSYNDKKDRESAQ